ncbi:MAG: alpha/beta fold hydrolase [Betaproteobacteria bacterium]|nr:alpha/beta fold hydrolase [Betaproteobacteria bacterium]
MAFAATDAPAIERATIAGSQPLELLYCHDMAQQTRVPLMFVHGAYVGAWCWAERFLPWFAARGFPVYALSLRGHGRSGRRENLHSYRIADYAKDLAAAVAHVPREPVLIGHSMGAVVAQKYLERPKAAAAALALMCPVPPFGLMPATFSLAFSRPGLFAQLNSLVTGGGVSRDAVREAMFGGPVDAEHLDACFARMQPESRLALLDLAGFDLPQRWRINLPQTLVLGAERDALIPAYLARSAAQMLGADYGTLPGLGHAVMLEADWQNAAQALLDWLEKARF